MQKNRVVYYKSVICPRCWPVDRRLAELRASQADVEIEIIEVLSNPGKAFKDRVMGIPLIIIGDKRWYSVPSLAELEAALLGSPQTT